MPDSLGLIDRAQSLVGVLQNRAERTERNRSLLPETVADFTKAGFWRMLQSRANCGFGVDIATHVHVVKEIARGCASSAWVLSLFSEQHFLAGAFGERARREIFAPDGHLMLALVFGPNGRAESVAGGYKLSGCWPYVSGIDICDWVALTSFDASRNQREPRALTFLVPRRECTVVDDWHVLGLRGTGSKSVVLNGVVIPAYRSFSFSDLARNEPVPEGPTLDFVPVVSLFVMCVAALAPGIARAAVHSFQSRIKTRRNAFMRSPQSADNTSHMRLAKALTRVDHADLLLTTAAQDLSRRVAARELIGPAQRTRYRLEMVEVLRICTEVVIMLFTSAGTGATMDSSPLQRHLRDMLALRSHAAVDPDSAAENYGRSLLELPPYPPLI
jgi:3-hydroxy-9,10-secoandrosta-1,3,5(10)-triene-9,17-dione monooxygenase